MLSRRKRLSFSVPIFNGTIILILLLSIIGFIFTSLENKDSYKVDLVTTGKLNRNQIEKYVQTQLAIGAELALDTKINAYTEEKIKNPNSVDTQKKLQYELDLARRRYDGMVKSITIIDLTHQNIFSSSQANQIPTTPSVYLNFGFQLSQSGETMISDLFKSKSDNEPYFLLGRYLGDKGRYDEQYVIVAEIDYREFMNGIREQFFLDLNSQTLYLLDSDGYIFESFGKLNKTFPVLEHSYSSSSVIMQIHNKMENNEMTENYAGDSVLAYYSPIKGSPWGIVIESNQNELYSLFVQNALLSILVVAVAWIGMYYLRKSQNIQIIEHGKDFEEIVTQIADGKEDIDLFRNDHGEFDGLYDAFHRLRRNLKHQKEKQEIILKIANILAINIELEKLLEELLPTVIDGTKSHWGVFYILNPITNKLEIKASRGLSKNVYKEFDINIGEGIVGQAALDHRIKIIKDIPNDTVYTLRTFLGNIKPKSIMAVPILFQGNMMGILLLSSIYNYREEQIDIVKVIRYYLGVAISNGLIYERTQRLSKELQFQNQLIQNLNDELEGKVKERTDFLDNIINSIKDYAIISLDKDGYITTWNRGAELLKGYRASEVIGEHTSIVYTEEERKLRKPEREIEMAKQDGQFIEYGWKTRKDGEKYFADIVITPMHDKNNNLVGFTKIIKDITASKKMEEVLLLERQLNTLLIENSREPLLLLNQQGVIVEANHLAESMLKYKREELVGGLIHDYVVDGHKLIEDLQIQEFSNGVEVTLQSNRKVRFVPLNQNEIQCNILVCITDI